MNNGQEAAFPKRKPSPKQVAKKLFRSIMGTGCPQAFIDMKVKEIENAISNAVGDERDACIEALAKREAYNGIHDNFITGFNEAIDQSERAIRARGSKKEVGG